MLPQRRRPERPGVPLRVVEVAHQDESRSDVGTKHVRPGDQPEERYTGQDEPRVEDDFLEYQSECHAEQQPVGGGERSAHPGHDDAQHREHAEVEHRVRGDEAEGGLGELAVQQGAREQPGSPERLARDHVGHQEPERHHRPCQDPARHALDDHRLHGSPHDSTSCWKAAAGNMASTRRSGKAIAPCAAARRRRAPPRASPAGYSDPRLS